LPTSRTNFSVLVYELVCIYQAESLFHTSANRQIVDSNLPPTLALSI
jgi:hypothetical protein